MPRRRRTRGVCAQHGCPTLTYDSRCPAHRLQTYGRQHQAHRAALAPIVADGGVDCARCGQPILPGQPWHDDHDDDRMTYLGASHVGCNSAAHA